MHRMGQEQENVTVVSQRYQRGTAATDATNEIRIVLYPGVQAACVHGLTDLFEIAANISRDQQRDGRFPLRVTHWQQRITAIPNFHAYMTAIRAGAHSRGS